MITTSATVAARELLRIYPNFVNSPADTFRAMNVNVRYSSKPLDTLAKHYGKDNLHGVILIDHNGNRSHEPKVTLYLDSRIFPKERRRSLCILMALYTKYMQANSRQDVILFENFSGKQPLAPDREYVEAFLHALERLSH